MMTKKANASVHIQWRYHVIFMTFAVSFLVFNWVPLGMVTGQHLPNYIEHHHNSHVCNHQHPKAYDVRSMQHLIRKKIENMFVVQINWIVRLFSSLTLQLCFTSPLYFVYFVHWFLYSVQFQYEIILGQFVAIVCLRVSISKMFFLLFSKLVYRYRE